MNENTNPNGRPLMIIYRVIPPKKRAGIFWL